MMGQDLAPRHGNLIPEKILRRHRERLAMVYIRQSTVQQVERHQESTRRQYALTDRAFQFGWARDAIVVIDDDFSLYQPRYRSAQKPIYPGRQQ
jgi:hypothetical protein